MQVRNATKFWVSSFMVQPEAGCMQPFLLGVKFRNNVVKLWGKNDANPMIF
jgi:hypothetical protein